MRLIWKKFDSTFDPVLTLVVVGCALAGLYGLALLRHAFQHPIVLIVAAIPALFSVMGVLIIVREVQLFRGR
jgi:predicted cation transporter